MKKMTCTVPKHTRQAAYQYFVQEATAVYINEPVTLIDAISKVALAHGGGFGYLNESEDVVGFPYDDIEFRWPLGDLTHDIVAYQRVLEMGFAIAGSSASLVR